ncbi:MAG: Ldh family oxidoreductase [Lachnospiraceae bacterium]|nr:Ldh family oxidoreductase [Lachnospiraceae bacterium]
MAHVKIKVATMDAFCMEVFQKFGFTEGEARIITDVLLLSDIYGIESHGAQRLVRYHKGIQSGMIKVEAKPEVVFETPVSAVIDGHEGMGQLIGHFGMELAIKKAKESGIGIVTVRESNHFGIAGYYAKMACDQGLIGFGSTNSEAIVVPTFGRKAMLGTNPIAISMPADPYPFFFDASTSVVTRGKFEMYNKAGKPVPDCWGADENGQACTNAGHVLANIKAKAGGGIFPLGGAEELTGSHKGYGYAMISEIFTAILSLGMTSNYNLMNNHGGTCHAFAAIDPAIFGDPQAIREHFNNFLQELRDSPKREGHDRIYTHGEKEVLATADRMANGIDVDVKTLEEMQDCANYVGVDFDKYFGDLGVEINFNPDEHTQY